MQKNYRKLQKNKLNLKEAIKNFEIVIVIVIVM
jgi:hypothetical protein